MKEAKYIDTLPSDLLLDGLFCMWKMVDNKKLPFNPLNNEMAKSNDPETFCSFYEAKKFIDSYYRENEGKVLGGLGFGIFNGFSAIDIDNCVENGTPNEFAREIIDFCQSYTEYSPSGKGIHIIFKNKDTYYNADRYYIKTDKLEVYVCGATQKFITISGNKYNYNTINIVDIKPLLEKYMLRPQIKTGLQDSEIQKVLEKDTKFAELWNSTPSGSNGNESETDLALINKIMFYCKCNMQKAKTIFELSPYFSRKDELHIAKWNNGYYAEHTLDKSYNAVLPSLKRELDLSIPQQPISTTSKYMEGTDAYNAEIFYKKHKNKYKYNYDNKRWMVWNGKYWQTDSENSIRQDAADIANDIMRKTKDDADLDPAKMREAIKIIKYLSSTKGIDNMLKEAQSYMPVSNYDLDGNPYLLCCDNGVYDLSSDTLNNFDRDLLISQSTGRSVSFETPTRWLQFLKEVFNNNERVINYIQKALGYSITNLSREQCMFILYGDGNNGKSLLLDVVREVLGSYSISSRPQLVIEPKYGNTASSEEVARLVHKRFCVIQEPKMGDFMDESRIKTLTSGNDEQVARYLYGNSFTFTFTGKLWLATNYDPRIKGVDKGIWRRIRKVNITTDFTGREDKDLERKLLEEGDDILGWLIQGFQLYRKEGLVPPKEIEEAMAEYRTENDIIYQWLVQECDIDPSYSCKSRILFEYFKRWARQYENRDFSQTMFGKQMGKKFKKTRDVKGNMVYYGVKVKDDILQNNPINIRTNLSLRNTYNSINLFDDKYL